MFDTNTITAIIEMADNSDVPAAALLAVVDVESGGRTSATVKGRAEPIIRYEGHYFDRLLSGDARASARAEGLASPKAGAIKNPRSQAGRWSLLSKAIRINRVAALSSVSWGVGQVMGSHWQWLGFDSVDAMVSKAREGVEGQIALMLRYIEKAGLLEALRKLDWVAFARTYNGPNFAKYGYDRKMATAYSKWTKRLGDEDLPEAMEEGGDDVRLMFGARGGEVKRLQQALSAKGYFVVADGLFGLITDRVLRRFQRDNFLSETGVAEQKTRCLLFDENLYSNRLRVQRLALTRQLQSIALASRERALQLQKRARASLREGLLSITQRFS